MKILSLGEKIKLKRKEMDLTLKNLAGDRITAGQISLVESGKSNPSMDLLEYLASALNVTVEYLMESEETQAEKICTYYENIAEANILNENFEEAEENIEISLFYAEKYNLDMIKARNLYLKAVINVRKKHFDKAEQILLSANSIFINNNSKEDVIKTFLLLGQITLDLKAYHSAYSYFQQAEKVFDDSNIGDDFIEGEIYYYIGITFFKLGSIEKSKKYSKLAEEKFNKIDDKRGYAKNLMDIAMEFGNSGDVEKAIDYSQKSLKLYKEIDNEKYISKIENDFGKLFSYYENIDESFKHLYKAKMLKEKTNDNTIIDTLTLICDNYIKLKDEVKARQTLDKILENIEKGNSRNERTLCDYYLLKYKIELLEGNTVQAESTLVQTLSYVNKMEYKKEAAEISMILGNFYISNGRNAEAVKCLNDGVKALKSLNILNSL